MLGSIGHHGGETEQNQRINANDALFRVMGCVCFFDYDVNLQWVRKVKYSWLSDCVNEQNLCRASFSIPNRGRVVCCILCIVVTCHDDPIVT